MWAPPVAARPHFSCLDTSDHTKRTWRGLQRVNILNVLIFEIFKGTSNIQYLWCYFQRLRHFTCLTTVKLKEETGGQWTPTPANQPSRSRRGMKSRGQSWLLSCNLCVPVHHRYFLFRHHVHIPFSLLILNKAPV